MGRKTKTEQEKKIKISVSIDRNLYNKIKSSGNKPSRVLEQLLRKHYEKEDLQ